MIGFLTYPESNGEDGDKVDDNDDIVPGLQGVASGGEQVCAHHTALHPAYTLLTHSVLPLLCKSYTAIQEKQQVPPPPPPPPKGGGELGRGGGEPGPRL